MLPVFSVDTIPTQKLHGRGGGSKQESGFGKVMWLRCPITL